jgi:hypothetical protein
METMAAVAAARLSVACVNAATKAVPDTLRSAGARRRHPAVAHQDQQHRHCHQQTTQKNPALAVLLFPVQLLLLLIVQRCRVR